MVVVNPEERFLLIMKYTENRKLITVALPEKTSENGLMIMMQEQNDQELVHNEKGAVRLLLPLLMAKRRGIKNYLKNAGHLSVFGIYK